MLRFALLVMSAALWLGASACNGESMTDEEFLELAEAAATAALLTSEDFPDSWTSSPGDEPDDGESDPEDVPEGLSDQCTELFERFDEIESGSDDAVASDISDDFESPENEGVSVEVEVYRNEGLLEDSQELFDSAFSECAGELSTALREEINADAEAEAAGYTVTRLEGRDLEERDLGDWARDWIMEVAYDFDGVPVETVITITFVRTGNILGTFMHFYVFDTDDDVIDGLRERFAEKMRDANDTLS
jgi:hypothetical protein